MTEKEMAAFKKYYSEYPQQDTEGWMPDRGSFKAGFFDAIEWMKKQLADDEANRKDWV